MTELSPPFLKEIAAETRGALVRVFVALLVIYGVFLAFNLSNLPAWREAGIDGTPIVALDSATPALIVGIIAWLWRSRPSLAAIHAVCSGFVAVAVTNALTSAVVLDAPRELLYVGFYLIGAGAILVDRRVVWAWVVVATAATMTVASLELGRDDILWAATCMASSSLFALIIHRARMDTFARVDHLRRADLARREELATAVERAESALAERIRAESERAELEQQLRRAQKLDALGTLAGGVAHDMNNVLAAITAVAATAADEQPEGSSTRADFEHILAASERGAALTRNLLGFARRGKRRNGPFDVRMTLQEVCELLRRTAPKRIAFELEAPEDPCVVHGDADQISHALMNLVLNAVDSIGGKGIVTLRCLGRTLADGEHHLLPAGRYVCLEVCDTGGGMDPEILERVFEPFFSTKSDLQSSGLGLSMVYGTVVEHGGAIDIESATGRGTAVSLLLPASAAAPEKPAAAAGSSPPAPRAPILVVDDEPLVRRAIARILDRMGVEHLLVDGGKAALEAARRPGARFSAVVLDLAMPGMSGAETLEQLREVDPDLPVLLASGYPKDQDVEQLLARGRVSFLAKPYRPDALAAALEALLEVDSAVTSRAG